MENAPRRGGELGIGQRQQYTSADSVFFQHLQLQGEHEHASCIVEEGGGGQISSFIQWLCAYVSRYTMTGRESSERIVERMMVMEVWGGFALWRSLTT